MLAALADAGIRPDLVAGHLDRRDQRRIRRRGPGRSRSAAGVGLALGRGPYRVPQFVLRPARPAGPLRHACALECPVATAARTASSSAPVRRTAGAIPMCRGQRGASGSRVVRSVGRSFLLSSHRRRCRGCLPPVRIDGEHYFDGGLVHSIPVGRAVQLGARRVFVLHVGRIEQPLTVPRRPWEVGLVAFEIARRHRFVEEMATLPDDVIVHVLPAGSMGAYRSDRATALPRRVAG